MSLVYALFAGLSIGEVVGGLVMLFLGLRGVLLGQRTRLARAKKRPPKRSLKPVF
jgi:hypothetical protein